MMFINFIFLFIFGTLIGSFLNVIIWRWPRGEKISGRSQCPRCHKSLAYLELIPLVSYVVLNGKCSNCQKPISPRYFIIELVTGLLFAFASAQSLLVTPIDFALLLRILFIIAILVVVFVIDLEHYLILDIVVLPATGVLLVFNIVLDAVAHRPLASVTVDSIIAALLASGFFYLIWKISSGRWMGLGDVKFNIFLGVALGVVNIIVALFAAFMIGAVVGVILLLTGKKQMNSKIPFGTFLSVGALLALFYGMPLFRWYFSLIG